MRATTATPVLAYEKPLTMLRRPITPTKQQARCVWLRARQAPRGSGVARTFAALLGAGLLVIGGRSVAGHQIGHYPSYYPDEIRIEVLEPAAAAQGLIAQTVHAYVGAAPQFAALPASGIASVKSLEAYLVISFNPVSAPFASAEARCAAAHALLADLRDVSLAGYVFHPYPVTPYHPDYLHHLDRVETARQAGRANSAKPATPARRRDIGARGELAQAIVRTRWRLAEHPDIVLETVPLADVLAASELRFNGWSEPPWLKEGWFHAYRLLARALPVDRREEADDNYARLVRGDARDLAEHANIERRLLAQLTEGCERVVAGYVVREEFFTAAYPNGIENVAYDSLDGLSAPVFLRTVKLKEYPWNGKLRLAVKEPPAAAWNPVAGFTDAMGRLIWSAVGDPAMIAVPFNASWMPNRVQAEVTKTEGQSGGIRVPADALRPRAPDGVLVSVGDRVFSTAKVVYEVITSPFEDGSEFTTADLFYPYAFAIRWGSGGGTGGRTYEPRLEELAAALHERVVGIRQVRVERTAHEVAEGMKVVWKTPVVELYLNSAAGDERQIAALAPPWSTVPWHLLVLMEEAVVRGHAAFSAQQAAVRGVPWLDLVRDRDLHAKLKALARRFADEGYRPAPLEALVSAEEAQARWRALATFADKNGHFLVSNGPYRLKRIEPGAVVLEAVRELSYPLGFGTFDRFVNPPRAVIATVARKGDRITVRAQAEMVLKGGREYRTVTEPLARTTTRGVYGLLVVSRYLLIDPRGRVVRLDKMQWNEDGSFTIELPHELPAGDYKVLLAIFLDGNSLTPSTAIVPLAVAPRASPG